MLKRTNKKVEHLNRLLMFELLQLFESLQHVTFWPFSCTQESEQPLTFTDDSFFISEPFNEMQYWFSGDRHGVISRALRYLNPNKIIVPPL